MKNNLPGFFRKRDPDAVLYLSYTGMLEPLGRSQVLSYLSRLSEFYKFTLVSFEKSDDLADQDAVASLRAECEAFGIDWRPQIYHQHPRSLATTWDLLLLIRQIFKVFFQKRASVVHCRSYIPAIAAWLCAKVTKTPFIFDMRALWPDEMVTAGRLRRKSLTYRALVWIERRLLRRAAKVVSLTQAAVDHLLLIYPELPASKFEVITTCADIERFNVPPKQSSGMTLEHRHPFVVGTMGTLLSGWFYLDSFFRFFEAVKEIRPDAVASIVTRDDHAQIFRAAEDVGVDCGDLRVTSARPEDMPAALAKMDLGVMFYAPDIGRAPTRLGEFLAVGVPVVGNTRIGDLDLLIEEYRVGVVVDDVWDSSALAAAASEMLENYDEILASGACRYAAEDYFSADSGADKYRKIYRSIINGSHSDS